MLNRDLPTRATAPTILVSLVLLGLCLAAFVYLYLEQAHSGAALGENVDSSRIAHDLESTLKDLHAEVKKGTANPEALHGLAEQQLGQARRLADKDEELELVERLETQFERYLALIRAAGTGDAASRADSRESALKVLVEMRGACDLLQYFNARQVQESEARHRRTVQGLVVGLAAVSGTGALAGLLLGYAVARRLRRSIYQLSVRIRDAAGKLGQDAPAVVVEDSDLEDLHEQVHGIAREIEQVVHKLRQREYEVLRAEQLAAVGQVAAGVAHELHNPLTSVKMLVQALHEDAETRGLPAEDLQIMEHEILRMERSLRTFLDFARPPRPERRPLNLADVVSRTFGLIGGRARKQGVRLDFHAPKASVLVEADAEQIQQLLVNLVLNALDAMPRGGQLGVELCERDSGQAELRVRDTGPGVPAELMPRLFEPFVSSKETGLGLGLVISRRIAESHGGSLEAVNLPEGGACFTLRLPLARNDEAMSNDEGPMTKQCPMSNVQ